jgi:2-furoyl-CoA dehydrogenase large subunit
VHLAATRLRNRLAGIAAAQLNARPEDLVFADGRVFAAANSENSLSFARVAATDHWSPAGSPEPALQETAFWSPSMLQPPNAADEVNGSAVYGFVFDFCGVEIDRDTGTVCVDTM